jgi:hypothetical protein
VSISPIDTMEGLEPISPLSQKIHVSEYREYIVNYLFKPTRSLRGRVRLDGGAAPAGRITLKLGTQTATTDKDGYYWFKTLPEGQFELSVTTVPKGHCVVGGNQIPIQIASPFAGQREVQLSTQCP